MITIIQNADKFILFGRWYYHASRWNAYVSTVVPKSEGSIQKVIGWYQYLLSLGVEVAFVVLPPSKGSA